MSTNFFVRRVYLELRLRNINVLEYLQWCGSAEYYIAGQRWKQLCNHILCPSKKKCIHDPFELCWSLLPNCNFLLCGILVLPSAYGTRKHCLEARSWESIWVHKWDQCYKKNECISWGSSLWHKINLSFEVQFQCHCTPLFALQQRFRNFGWEFCWA